MNPEEPEGNVAAVSQRDTLVVLLVDDQPFVAEAVRRMLADQADIQLHYERNPHDALTATERLHPAVILQDLVMPDVDGLTLITQYRAASATRDIPIIVLSSKEDPLVKRDAFLKGANDYLVKLPDPVELVARIRLHANAYRHRVERDVLNQLLVERIGELQEARDELSRLVSTDVLSGLYSRRRWLELAAVEFSRQRRYKHPFAILVADLDFFKRINDTYGHSVGDEVIRQAGALLHAHGRQSDAAGRLGGEEFGILLPETPADGAEECARRIVQACRDLNIPVAGSELKVSWSVGGAVVTPADENVEQVLQRADAALYDAKRGGRDGWRFR